MEKIFSHTQAETEYRTKLCISFLSYWNKKKVDLHPIGFLINEEDLPRCYKKRKNENELLGQRLRDTGEDLLKIIDAF